MGRTEKSQGLAPPAIRKDIRAKQARHIINKVVPALLASNARARRGADGSELISDPGPASNKQHQRIDNGGEDVAYIKRKGPGRRKAKGAQELDDEEPAHPRGKVKKSGKRRNDSIDEDLSQLALHAQPAAPTSLRKHSVKVITTDSLTAAQLLASIWPKHSKKSENVCVLNMASPLRPGGGVLVGATSQEEFLCARTTLLPSLKEDYYRLPEFGGIFTPDVLVFRGPGSLGDSAGELGTGERYWVDVISAGMLRFPDLEGEDEAKRLGKKDREIVERKMRAVLRIAAAKGVKKLVLGAWGCGAYGNPVVDVAQAWSRVLSGLSTAGAKKGKAGPSEAWPDLEDVLFAIPNPRVAKDFASAFDDSVEVEEGPRSFDEEDENEDEGDKVTQDLQSKIEEMESQISKVWNADLKSRLGVVLDGLKAQLRERQGEQGEIEESSEVGDGESGEDEDDRGGRDRLKGGSPIEPSVDADEANTDSGVVDSGVVLKL